MSTDLRELRVIPLVELYCDDAGAYVERERGRSRLGRLLERWLRVPQTVRVELDEYGAAAWRAMRNGAPVRQLGEALRQEFGDDAEPLWERLGEFLAIAERGGLLRLEPL
ncbi:MAG: PqqD family protein [Candidatus Thermoplasmatota archaeon]|nr:PqqD family protein [Candidatus Thermoplasmatota archaeon]